MLIKSIIYIYYVDIFVYAHLYYCIFIGYLYGMGTSQHYLSLIVPRLAILRRHCPEPAAPAGVEWWTLCLAARMKWHSFTDTVR